MNLTKVQTYRTLYNSHNYKFYKILIIPEGFSKRPPKTFLSLLRSFILESRNVFGKIYTFFQKNEKEKISKRILKHMVLLKP